MLLAQVSCISLAFLLHLKNYSCHVLGKTLTLTLTRVWRVRRQRERFFFRREIPFDDDSSSLSDGYCTCHGSVRSTYTVPQCRKRKNAAVFVWTLRWTHKTLYFSSLVIMMVAVSGALFRRTMTNGSLTIVKPGNTLLDPSKAKSIQKLFENSSWNQNSFPQSWHWCMPSLIYPTTESFALSCTPRFCRLNFRDSNRSRPANLP
jgi:hypothetical protein